MVAGNYNGRGLNRGCGGWSGRWLLTQEVTAMGKLTKDELEVVYKQGLKPSEYLAGKAS